MRSAVEWLYASAALFYQGHRDLLERAAFGVALAVLAGGLLQIQATYTTDWMMMAIAGLVVAALVNPALGYFVAIVLVAWPLWRLSPYLATLFLAITVLGHVPILRRLPVALLVAASPLLAWYLVAAITPLFSAVLLGATTGFWAGVLAALWLKLVGGMAGIRPDLLTLHQEPLLVSAVAARFAGVNSLVTLQRLVAPFAGDSSFLLLDVLQVLGWGFGGYLVGWVRRRRWAERRPWVGLGVALAVGALVLVMVLFVLPIWLQLAPARLVWSDPFVIAGVLVSALLVALFYAARFFLQQPVRRMRWRIVPAALPATGGGSRPGDSGAPARRSLPVDDPRPADVIMLELD